jgi:hypothetical protein
METIFLFGWIVLVIAAGGYLWVRSRREEKQDNAIEELQKKVQDLEQRLDKIHKAS